MLTELAIPNPKPNHISKEFQDRLIFDTLDLAPSLLPDLYKSFKKLGFSEWSPPITGPYRSLYFLPSEQIYFPFTVRARTYGVSSETLTKDPLYISPADFAVFEIKRKLGNHEISKRQEIKYRQYSRLGRIFNAVSNLAQATEIIQLKEFEQTPYGYPPAGTIPKDVLQELIELNIPLEPAFTITSIRDHWIADPENPDRLRITIDRDYFYHTLYGTEGPYKTINLGTYPWARLEIKAVDNQLYYLAETVNQLILEKGGFPPLKKGDAKRAYYWNKLKAVSPISLAPLIRRNELNEDRITYEMEGKIALLNNADPEKILTKVYDIFKNGNIAHGIYGIQQTAPHTRSSTTISKYYGIGTINGLEQGLTITTNERKPDWIGIKRKSPATKDQVQFRAEDKQNAPYQGKLTSETETLIIESEQKLQGKKLIYVGDISKTKYRAYVENRQTYRTYIVSIDHCVSNGQILQQIEIEYGLRWGAFISTFASAKTEIQQDIQLMMEVIVSHLNNEEIKAEPTTQTKFEWLLQHNGNK